MNFTHIWLGSGVKEGLSNVSLKYHVPIAESSFFHFLLIIALKSMMLMKMKLIANGDEYDQERYDELPARHHTTGK